MTSPNGPLRVGIGGPVGTGKTTLTSVLARALAPRLSMAVITNDIYTREDAEFLMRAQVLPLERIRGVETGGCPHTAIREDASINLAALADLRARFPDLGLMLIDSGGDNLAATFSPELEDLTIYVIDVAAGQDIPARAARRSPDQICSSSTNATSRPMSASRSKNTGVMSKPCARGGLM